MLRTRIITALILAPLALATVIYLPTPWLGLVFGVVAALGAYEWAGLLGATSVAARLAYVAAFAVLAFILFGQEALYTWIMLLGCIWWLFAALIVLTFPRAEQAFKQPWVTGALGFVVLVPAWLALVVVHSQPQGNYWLIWMFFLVWGADIGAYFAGRAFGRRKLAPAVSPGKTWEGAFGGFLLAAAVCGSALPWLTQQWLWWLPVIAMLVIISVFGDLFESVLKRSTGIKDSGTLLPGHGGVLDRIDALIAVLPFMAVVLSYI